MFKSEVVYFMCLLHIELKTVLICCNDEINQFCARYTETFMPSLVSLASIIAEICVFTQTSG